MLFRSQYNNNLLYRQFCKLLNINGSQVKALSQIPFLPIQFFKTNAIKTGTFNEEQIFLSSGTSGQQPSKHYVKNLSLYEISYQNTFSQFYGNVKDYCILALLPSYLERKGSSLIYMIDDLDRKSVV